MGIIQDWRLRRQHKRKLKEMASVASVFATLKKLEVGGMIHWDGKLRRMFIEQPLAVLMMQDAEKWQNFIQNLYLYTYYGQCQQAWADYMLREELAAVRKAQTAAAGTIQLSRYDIERIRSQRRDEILQSDIEPPKVEGFEFFLISEKELNHPAPSPAPHRGGETSAPEHRAVLIAVGWYDPEREQIEMAPWSEIAPLVQKKT